MVEYEPGETGPKDPREEDPAAEAQTPDPPILLGRDAIRAAWDAAKGAE